MKRWWPLLTGMMLLDVFIIRRAIIVPITHDEASTWLNFRHFNMWSCATEYYCWMTANNHWLNTILLQGSANLFGEAPWALRLPNVIAGMLYILGAVLFVQRYISSTTLRVAGFLLLTAHVYLLDFFSLVRGYGLLSCAVLWSVILLLRYFETFSWSYLAGIVTIMILGVLSNFTGLLPMAALGATWMSWVLLQKKYTLLYRHGWMWLLSALILYPLLEYPIRMLADSGEFLFGSRNLLEMIKDLAGSLMYGATYFGMGTASWMGWLLVGGLCCIVIWVWIKRHTTSEALNVVILFMIFNLAVIVALQVLTGALAPIGRKSIYLIPVFFLVFALGLNFIRHHLTQRISGIIIPVLLVFHFSFAAPWPYIREWYYDAYYPQLFKVVMSDGDSVRLGSSWIFNPALQYYRSAQSLPLAGLKYEKNIVVDSTMQYYYLESTDTIKMRDHGFVRIPYDGPFYLYRNTALTKALQ